MNIHASVFRENILDLLNQLNNTQKDHIDEASELLSDCISNDGVLHIFGTGHSIGMGIEMTGKIGNLVPIHMMKMTDFVTKGIVSLEEFNDKENDFERKSNLAQKFYELYDIRPQDAFMIISNSGINGMVIDLAIEAQKHGHSIIVVTSMQHTKSENSRHPSGKKLYMFGNIVIDNCGPHGDALLPTEGVANVCSVSSICNNFIAQSLTVKTVEKLVNKKINPPILTENSINNEALLEHYKGRLL